MMQVMAYGGRHNGKKFPVTSRLPEVRFKVTYEEPELGLDPPAVNWTHSSTPHLHTFEAIYPVMWDRVLGHPDTGVVYSPVYWLDEPVHMGDDL